jgi:non-homologous end joining protein Ku
MGKIAQLET